ncbi:OmpA family protein [Paludibacteraceae bacterium OttesenSCG-928-F17]|nr:OmpA family protein [Paludibacteraceae bacterium OttesenSCG-928-F17]
MRIKSSHIILLFLLASLLLQGCGVKARLKKADRHYEVGEYYTAGEIYRKSYGKVSRNDRDLRGEVAFKQGESYRLTNHPRTETAYMNAIRNNYPDSIVYFHYAQILQKNGKYGEAVKNYEIYLQNHPENIAAQNGLMASQVAAEWAKAPTRYKVSKSKDFNVRRFSSYAPAYVGTSADGLVFTSSRSSDKKKKLKNNAITGQPNAYLYTTRKNASDKWEAPDLLNQEINTSIAENGVATFSVDGKTMYFTRARKADEDAAVEILLSNRSSGEWGQPNPIKLFSDSTISVAHPTTSPDGTILYFVSDAPNGFGGKDIWKATIEGGEYKYIENLGDQINTPGNEMFPMMRADGVLYFASDGHTGFGGLDIYKAIPIEGGGWDVYNMGVPINSSADDFGITFEGISEKGFFSSNRDERQGQDMIWSFELPELTYILEGKVRDDKGEVISDAIIRLVGNNGTNARIQAKKDGTYRLKLDKNVDYVMLASSRGYLNQSNKLETHGLKESKTYNINFQLSPLFKPVQIENIFYEFGKWDLTPASETGLQELLKLLNDNPNITIEISAHTDYVGNDQANKILSEKRAQSVVNYLIAAGVAADRLTAVGHGKEQPFMVDIYTVKKFPFLKEGDVLTEDFIKTLTPPQQEQANQINRRTEFRVLRTTYNLY